MGDWSQLPNDLITFVARHLTVEDFLSFSAVCHSWQFVYLNRDWISSHSIPWLMFGDYHEHDVPTRQFFSLSRSKVYKLPLPEVHGCLCWGTSYGWILAFNELFEICLVNPITRARIDLPPLPVLTSEVSSKDEWFSAVQQAILVKQRDNYITFVINRYSCCLAFSRVGEREWTQFPLSDRLFNIVSFKDQILAITVAGTLMRLDIDRPDCPRAHTVAPPPEDVKFWYKVYLVVSSENLLLVYQWYQRDKLKFEVYKFVISCKTLGWLAPLIFEPCIRQVEIFVFFILQIFLIFSSCLVIA